MTAQTGRSDRLQRWDVEGPIPRRLPLVDALVGEHPADLGSASIVLVQHHTGSLVPMVQALLDLGAQPEWTFLVDIPYSTHPTVQRALLELGVPAGNLAEGSYRLDLPFAAFQADRTRRLLQRVLAQLDDDRRLLILDDGAYAVEALSDMGEQSADVLAVEQTVFGVRKLRENARIRAYAESIPIVNVAESAPKKRDEAAFLGHAIASALARSHPPVLARMRSGRTLLLGYGAIGAAVGQALVSDLDIEPLRIGVGDPLPSATELARSHGLAVWKNGEAPVDVLIGCSGRRSFRPSDARLLADGAILASGSSGAIELSCDILFDLAQRQESKDVAFADPVPLARRSLHSHVAMRLYGRDVLLLNGGFPVDFDGSVNGVPSHLIQLTRALMLAGAVQALSEKRCGLVPLREDLAAWTSRRFAELVSAP